MREQIIPLRPRPLERLADVASRLKAAADIAIADFSDRFALYVGERALSRLDDRQLKDIGLDRSQIRSVLKSRIDDRRHRSRDD